MNKFNYGDKCKVSFYPGIDFTYLSAHPSGNNVNFVFNTFLGVVRALDDEIEVVESATQNAPYKADYENATEALTKIASTLGMQYGVDCGFGNLHKYVRNTIENHKNHGEHLDSVIREMRGDFFEIAKYLGIPDPSTIEQKELVEMVKDKITKEAIKTNEKEQESFFKHGEKCSHVEYGNDLIFIGTSVVNPSLCYVEYRKGKSSKGVQLPIDHLGKPGMTVEEKAGRDLFELSFKSVKYSGASSVYEGDWNLVSDEDKKYWIHFAKQLGFTTGI